VICGFILVTLNGVMVAVRLFPGFTFVVVILVIGWWSRSSRSGPPLRGLLVVVVIVIDYWRPAGCCRLGAFPPPASGIGGWTTRSLSLAFGLIRCRLFAYVLLPGAHQFTDVVVRWRALDLCCRLLVFIVILVVVVLRR
jgi:hypothetical protein